MIFQTQLRDCLFLNWALPVEELPDPPSPLRWERHPGDGGDFVFASALLFRQEGLRWSSLPLPRLSYPQLNLRLYVLDGEGVPSVLFVYMLVPGWVVPVARWMAKQPVHGATFHYPRPGEAAEGEVSWKVSYGGGLEVVARVGSPRIGAGPELKSWTALVELLRQRQRGYGPTRSGLRRVDARQPSAEVVPMQVELGRHDLLPECLGDRELRWPQVHSAWLCPRLPFVFEVGPSLAVPVPRTRPAVLGNCTHGATRRMS